MSYMCSLLLLTIISCSCHIAYSELFDYSGDDELNPNPAEDAFEVEVAATFNGNEYEKIQVSWNGALVFGQDTYGPQFPRQYYIHDPPLIAVFYIKSSLNERVPGTGNPPLADRNPAKLYHKIRQSSDASHRQYIDRVKRVLRTYMAGGVGDLQIETVLSVTWYRLASEDDFNAGKRNTYQALLVTGQQETFVILNYDQIEWSRDLASRRALAGMNLGHASKFISLPDSSGESIENLENFEGGPEPGRFVFRVGSLVARGGCLPPESNLKSIVDMWPREGGLLGGTEVELSGPCITANSEISCAIGGKEATAEYVNMAKVRCISKQTGSRGFTNVSLTVNGRSYTSSGSLLVSSVEGPHGVTLNEPTQWAQEDPVSLGLSWQPRSVGRWSSNETDILRIRLNISLMAYIDGQDELVHLEDLGISVLNDGTFTIDPRENRCSVRCNYKVGLIRITAQHTAGAHTYLWSPPFPLAWYNYEYLQSSFGSEWAAVECKAWQDSQYDMSWIEELPSCPCVIGEVLMDSGRWVPDPGCHQSRLGDPNNCVYHPGASHCVRSINPTRDGAGNQCCYSTDGQLMTGADSSAGSTADRAFHSGSSPFRGEYHVPWLSHYTHDVYPYQLCCMLSQDNCFRYMAARPTISCFNNKPSSVGFIFGDPHLYSFHGQEFHYNGLGEYTLLQHSDQLVSHARLERLELASASDPLNASYISAIAVRSPSSGPVIEFMCAFDSSSELSVYVDRAAIDLHNYQHPFTEIKGVHLLDNDRLFENQKTHKNVTASFSQSGVSIQVTCQQMMLHVMFSLPPELMHGAAGMLMYNTTLSSEQAYNSLRASYHMSSSEGLLGFYQNGKVFETINIGADTFTPDFNPQIDTTIRNYCQRRRSCEYDYAVTRTAEIAEQTRDLEVHIDFSRQANATSRCPSLVVYYADKSVPNSVDVGTEVVISCWNGYTLYGPERYTCVNNGNQLNWEPVPSTSCLSEAADSSGNGKMAGIIAGSVIAAVLILAIVAYIIWAKRTGRPIIPGTSKSEEGRNHLDVERSAAANKGFTAQPETTSSPTTDTQYSPVVHPNAPPRSREPVQYAPTGHDSDYGPPSYATEDPRGRAARGSDAGSHRGSHSSLNSQGSGRGRSIDI